MENLQFEPMKFIENLDVQDEPRKLIYKNKLNLLKILRDMYLLYICSVQVLCMD